VSVIPLPFRTTRLPSDPPIELHAFGSAVHRSDLDHLAGLGVSIPERWRPRVTPPPSGERRYWVADTTPDGRVGLALSVSRTRKVPWASLARLEQLGDRYFAERADRVMALLTLAMQRIGGIMRLEVRLLDRADAVRSALSAALLGVGARSAPSHRVYRLTHLLDIEGTPSDRLARLSPGVRAHITRPSKLGLVVRTNGVTPKDVPFLASLMASTFRRTGGSLHTDEVQRDLQDAIAAPEYRPIFTLEHAHRDDSERIVAFAMGCDDGDHVTYRHGASVRSEALRSMTGSFPVVWAMVEWAAARGHRWVDLGGITPVDDHDHPLAGISAFKRRFAGQDALVAEEYELVVNARDAWLERRIAYFYNRIVARPASSVHS
jgi:hypothetical protein